MQIDPNDVEILEHVVLLSGWSMDGRGARILNDSPRKLWFRLVELASDLRLWVYDAPPAYGELSREPIHSIQGREHQARLREIATRARLETSRAAAAMIMRKIRDGDD